MAVSDLTVEVRDVHLHYRVRGQRNRARNAGPASAVRRLASRERAGGGTRTVHAVRGISFVVARGEAVGIIGPNGSGKSTLLRAVAGLMPPTAGSVRTRGRASLLGVSAVLLPDLTGERNVVLGLLALGVPRSELADRAAAVCDFAEIGSFIGQPMRTYSSGMAARLRFAISSARPSQVLLIDEALATGDARFRRRSEARVAELRNQAGTVLLVSHSLGVVRATCQRTIWVERGELVMDGPSDEVVDAYVARHDPAARHPT